PWFAAAKFGMHAGFALAAMLAQLVPAKVSCVAQGAVLAVVFVAYIVLCLWLRPFKTRVSNAYNPFSAGKQLVDIVAARAASASGQPNDSGGSWVDAVVVASVTTEAVRSVLAVAASLLPFLSWIRRIVGRIRGGRASAHRNGSTENQRRHDASLSALMQ